MANLERLRKICEQTRRDFERGSVSRNEIVGGAARYGVLGWLVSVQTGEVLARYDIFPHDCCDLAAIVLRGRAEEAGAICDRAGFIEGGYLLGKYLSSSRYHVVLDTGEVGQRKRPIIADITSDQFNDSAPGVYVGPLVRPWTTVRGYSTGLLLAEEQQGPGNGAIPYP